MITFDKVTKKFPLGNLALDNVSFEIDDNEFVFLVGPSGAGKTSIIKLILREIIPTSGSVLIDDLDVTDKNFTDTVDLRRNIGIVFQDFKVLSDKNIFENVSVALKVTGGHFHDIKNKVSEVLKLVGLEEKENYFPIQLSAGELQRVAIARAIIGNRKIILADEPTGNLDPKTSWEIMKIFKRLEDNKTIIIATHNIDIVNSFQKRVIILKQGKIKKDIRKGGYEI